MGQTLTRYFHRNAILEAATTVFAKRGTQSVTVEDLLKASRVSRRTFYEYFDSKDAVLEAIYDIACAMLVDSIRDAARRHTDPNKRLEACVDVYLSFNSNRTSGALLRVLEAEAVRSERLGPKRLAIVDLVGAECARHLEDAGESPDPLLVHGVVSALEAISMRIHREGTTALTLKRAKRAMLRLLTATLAGHGVAATPLPRASTR